MASATLDRYSSLTSHRALRKSTGSDEINGVDVPIARRSTASDEISWGQVSQQVDRIEKRLSSRTPADALAQLNGTSPTDKLDSAYLSDAPSSTPTQSLKQLPLTPPQLADGVEPGNDEQSAPGEPAPTTPMPQRSPPTPDQTPPRRLHLNPRAASSSASHQASSVTGSFMTAQEEFSTDSLAIHPALRNRSRSPTPARDSAIGLGLGLEMPNGHRTPTAPSPRIMGDALAAVWPSEAVETDPFLAPESLAVQEMDKRPRDTEDFQASFERVAELPARENGALSPWERPTSQDSDYPFIDPKRLSDISSTSQVVQAIVIRTPRKKRQRLRHCGKNESLRTASSPIESSNVESSNRSSLVSNEGKHRPLHRTPRIDWNKRASQNSDSGISMLSGPPKPPPELMGRMSSLRRSSAKDRALSRRYSDLARETEPQRPVTAPETTKEPEETRRTSSLVVRKSSRAKRTIDYPPVIPVRGSSLSAPTSGNNSRTASMSSANLQKPAPPLALGLKALQRSPKTQQLSPKSQQLSPNPQQLSPNPQQLSPKLVLRSPRVDRHSHRIEAGESEEPHHGEDRYSGRRRSMLATPFSGVSALSSTPGPFELDEATAINIFPHNNTSVLVVQRFNGDTEPSTRLSGNVSIQLDEVHGRARLLSPPKTFSPLRNPRPAPAPVVTLTAPSPTQDGTPIRRSPHQQTASMPSRISTVRRALSGKRHSENLIAPYTRPLVERREVSQPAPKSSTLWRPRGFWNDVDDPDTEAEAPDVYVRNTLGLPQRKLIPGPGSLSRRIGSLRRRKEAQASGQAIEDVEKRVGILARLRGQGPPLKPFASLAEAIEKLRSRRDEKRAESQREWLRRRIGPVVLPAHAHQFRDPTSGSQSTFDAQYTPSRQRAVTAGAGQSKLQGYYEIPTRQQ